MPVRETPQRADAAAGHGHTPHDLDRTRARVSCGLPLADATIRWDENANPQAAYRKVKEQEVYFGAPIDQRRR